ncbi:MAG: complex I subunit 4 family protein, partial [Terriglobales bacterium]
MTFLHHTVLSWIVFLPVIGIGVILLMPGDRAIRWAAFAFSLADLVVALWLPFAFRAGQAGFQFQQNVPWIPAFHIHYYLGVDGISLWLLPLTALMTWLAILASWKHIHRHSRAFYLLMLLLSTGMLGAFVSLDLFLFYVFWELALIPLTLLVGIWGQHHRIYAAYKFLLYTMAGSMLMLACIIWLYNLTGTFSFPSIQAGLASGAFHIGPTAAMWLFLGFFIAFAIKTPLFPFHSWLPDVYSEAPAAAVVMSVVMVKLGPYGLLRFNLTLFPHAAARAAWVIVILGLIGLIYGGLVAFSQKSMTKLVAYGSVSHMSLIIIGVFTFTALGTQGAVYQMLNHGIITGGLFILIGILYEQRHTADLAEFGGLAKAMPWFAGFFVLLMLASVGLPMLSGFVGEFLIMLGAFLAHHVFGIIAAAAIIVSALYLLKWTRATLFGEITHSANATLRDLDARERFIFAVIAVLVIFMGLFSPLFLRKVQASVAANVAPYANANPFGVTGRAPSPALRAAAVPPLDAGRWSAAGEMGFSPRAEAHGAPGWAGAQAGRA